MGRKVDIVLTVEERRLDGGRSLLGLVLAVSGSSPESFTSAAFRRSELGPRLFEELLPEALRRRLWSLRTSIREARVDTDEAWIPWEFLRFRGPGRERRDSFAWTATVRRPVAAPAYGRGAGKELPDLGEIGGYWLGIDDTDVSRGLPGASESREVEVTSVVPESVRPAESFLVEVVFHVKGYEVVAGPGDLALPKATLSLRDGTRLTLRLVSMGEGLLLLDGCEAAVEWRPPARRSEFLLAASGDAAEGSHYLRLEIWLDRVQLARAYVNVVVDPRAAPAARRRPASLLDRMPRSVFASYCRRDRDRVLDRIAALEAVGIDVFLDGLDIRQGEDWQKVLHREIRDRELLLLFWSCAARESEWVEREWRYALENRGIDYILPNALDPPEHCPPPDELGSLNFGSVIDRLRRDWHDPAPA